MKDSGYIPKDLAFNEDARTKLTSGISKISNAVKSTLGPQGQTVLIESTEHTQGLTVTKDGVTVAKSISLILKYPESTPSISMFLNNLISSLS